jgi:hypothetical protein
VPALLAALCDDAALFPPGDAPVAAAVPAHRGHRAAWYAGLVGPFLVGADRVAEVGAAAAPDGALEVVLVVRAGPAALGPALAGAAAWPELRLVAVEVGPDAAGTPAEAAARACAALARELPDAVTGVVELRRAPDPAAALDAVAASPYRAKYRTGGPDAASFPPVAELAAFLSGCAERDLPFKCTAGLHRAVRHTDPATGFTHHGFLNILAATHAAAQRDPEATAHLLGTTSGTEPAAVAAGMTGHQIQRARGLFTGYGTCSIAEPLHDLAALGLLAHASLPPTTLDRP